MTKNLSEHMHTLCHWSQADATSYNLYTNSTKQNIKRKNEKM